MGVTYTAASTRDVRHATAAARRFDLRDALLVATSVVSLLATSLEIGRPDVRIVSGAVSRDKVVEIVGLTLEEAEQRLTSARKGTA